MVHYHVEYDFHPAAMGFFDQLQCVIHRPVFGSDVGVVGNVVAEIRLRGSEERGNPNCLEAQVADVVQFLEDALQVADPVRVAVIKRARINLVDRGFVIPGDCHHFYFIRIGWWRDRRVSKRMG